MKFQTIKSNLLFYAFLFCTNEVGTEGFLPATLIKTFDKDGNYSLVPIQELSCQDIVATIDLKNKKESCSAIKNIVRKQGQLTKLFVKKLQYSDHEDSKDLEICLATDHPLFVPRLEQMVIAEKWFFAKSIIPGQLLFRYTQNNQGQIEQSFAQITKVESCEDEEEFICLSLEKDHNYFVSELEFLVHNIDTIPQTSVGMAGEVIKQIAANAEVIKSIGTAIITAVSIGNSLDTLGNSSKKESTQPNKDDSKNKNENSTPSDSAEVSTGNDSPMPGGGDKDPKKPDDNEKKESEAKEKDTKEINQKESKEPEAKDLKSGKEENTKSDDGKSFGDGALGVGKACLLVGLGKVIECKVEKYLNKENDAVKKELDEAKDKLNEYKMQEIARNVYKEEIAKEQKSSLPEKNDVNSSSQSAVKDNDPKSFPEPKEKTSEPTEKPSKEPSERPERESRDVYAAARRECRGGIFGDIFGGRGKKK